jgi:hypothetical protein
MVIKSAKSEIITVHVAVKKENEDKINNLLIFTDYRYEKKKKDNEILK